jgi:GAF domain-containing protein
VQNFAAQAVIAIENTRLLNELRQSLEQQTATADVLRVISSSPGQLEPVFQAMLENATRICDAEYGLLFNYDGRLFNTIAARNVPPSLLDFMEQRGAFLPPPGTVLHDMLTTRNVVHRADASALPVQSAPVQLGGAKAFLAVPMFKDETLVGAISIYRQEARPFSDKQIALLTNFAAQAVIAIENTRLLNELRQRTDELSQRTDDLSEALEQQTATSEVLKVISSSPGDLEPVFEAMLENATRICDAKFGNLWLTQDDGFLVAATHGIPPEYRDRLKVGAVSHPGQSLPLSRAKKTRQVVHITDLSKYQSYLDGEPVAVSGVEVGKARTLIIVPMLREKELVGAFAIYRQEVRPFTDKLIALVQNFAAQAVIAIENTRLLNELRGRTLELTEALEQRTATSEVLGVISSSPAELTPVFNTILANALRLCEADTGHVLRAEAGALSIAAMRGGRPEYAQLLRERGPWRPPPDSAPAQTMEQKKPVQIADMSQTSSYAAGVQVTVAAVELGGLRTVLMVPMIADEKAIGIIVIYRSVVRPFSDKQIALVENFAKQAVIAIENARLLNELRQRTSDLTESLEQQTATSEVLSVISSSAGELEPIFQAMLENAVRICDATFG